jgi:hypothetical protein
MGELLTWNSDESLSFSESFNLATNALASREKIRNYFDNVLAPGSYAYNTHEMSMFKKMTIDWASTTKTFQDTMKHASDAFSLDEDDVDKAIRGFGIDFINRKTVKNLLTRQFFLLALTDLYKIKGSSKSIVDSLAHCGLHNCIMREYWIERVPHSYKNIEMRGIACGKWKQKVEAESYVWMDDQNRYHDTLLTWDNFEQRQLDIGEPHWWYKSQEIVDIEWSSTTHLKLPSITPYFGVSFLPDIQKINTALGIIEKLLSEQFNSYLSGNDNLLSRVIGTSGSDDDSNQRNLYVTGFDEPLTMLECYLAWVYCQIRSDEYNHYTHLITFLNNKQIFICKNYKIIANPFQVFIKGLAIVYINISFIPS